MREIRPGDDTTLGFIHLTDSHLLDGRDDTLKGFNTLDSFSATLDESLRCHPEADFILLTGDISQHGSRESYQLLEAVLNKYKLPVYAVPGNHDTPHLLSQVIPSTPAADLNIIKLGNVSLVLINSQVSGEHSGNVGPEQLRQLDTHLANSNSELDIIAIHHPPVSINSEWLDELGLRNRNKLMDILGSHTGNTMLLCGHIHQELDQQVGNVRIMATPSTCFQFAPGSIRVELDDKSGPAYRYIELNTHYQVQTEVRYIKWREDFSFRHKIQNS